jgi:hypothetical protein
MEEPVCECKTEECKDYMTVTDIIEHEDGSATVTFDMPSQVLAVFAKVGLEHVLKEYANKVLTDYNNLDQKD